MQRIFSGIQPTNNLHLGNYLGAIKNWVELQNQYDAFYCIVDLHAITIKQDPKQLRQNILNAAKTYLALGLDPAKCTIFVQSHVPQHTELAWVLNTIAKMSELERMTQFKDKAKQHKENINLGLFAYPALMAADILLYSTNVVPVGEDQKQHVELTRDLAARFNSLYGKTFIEPEPRINKVGARIMGLDDPSKKMSKSAASANSYIALLDPPEVVAKKISRAVTDSGTTIQAGTERPALTNLLTIYSLLTNQSVEHIEKEYTGKGYADFKKGLSAVVTEFISNFQHTFNALDDNNVQAILKDGATKARAIAEKKMEEVKTKIGLL
ncbi:MAG: tryptophan--tRNA ligase [Candidatus Magasanikbacteria bacterium]|nr:tryptophan--tRNA ligase [Candidatus Magasanikbacteria bacterium]